MPSKITGHELIEPLQSFLETFTQELTEQKFVPAFRDELKRLLGALENLQQSEESLQQIARGVERLREAFAPAGSRLIESVRDIEGVLHGHADQFKDQAESVLKDLLQTHEQLEGALRSEADLLKDQTSAGREALTRATADIEQRLTVLTGHMDSITRRLESEKAAWEDMTSAVTREAAVQPAPAALPPEWPEEVRSLLVRSEQTLREELTRYQEEVADLLSRGRGDDTERLTKLEHKLGEAVASLGPRVQEELDQAVGRLRDQIQALILAEIETRAMRPAEGQAAEAASADLSAALTASETRILREISTLQKGARSEAASDRILKELATGMEAAAEGYAERLAAESQKIRDSLTVLQRMIAPMREGEQQNREQLTLLGGNLDTLVKSQREQSHQLDEQFRAALGRLDAQSRSFEQRAEEERQHYQQLSAAFARVEQATTSATELTMADSRAQRDRIEAGIRDLRDRLERGLTTDGERTSEMLRQIAESWTEALEALRDFVSKTVGGRTDSILARLEGLEARLSETGQASGVVQRELQTEIKRAGALFDERVQALKSETDSFISAIETHVKAVSGEVAGLRSKQEQSLAVLKEAIHANYDEGATRLREVVESVYDQYVKQTTSVPQALERVAQLVQSISHGDQLTMQTIASDTKNVLNMSTEKFELLLGDSTAMKKFFPLLNQRLEKQSAELELTRKGQVQQDKELAALQQTLAENREAQESQTTVIREKLGAFRSDTDERFASVQENLSRLETDLSAVQDEHFPAFRRELSNLLTSRFEFIEKTLHERREAERKELAERDERAQAAGKKSWRMVVGLVALTLLTQILFYLMHIPGAGK
jgi:hypothetical protein